MVGCYMERLIGWQKEGWITLILLVETLAIHALIYQ
jgi:hypothetical protein